MTDAPKPVTFLGFTIPQLMAGVMALGSGFMGYQKLRDDLSQVAASVAALNQTAMAEIRHEVEARQAAEKNLGDNLVTVRDDLLDRLAYIRSTAPGRYKQ